MTVSLDLHPGSAGENSPKITPELALVYDWLRRAATYDGEAQNKLGAYLSGVAVPDDAEQALSWLQAARDERLFSVVGASYQSDLGQHMALGWIADLDYELLKLRVEADAGSAYSEFELGCCYMGGLGEPQNVQLGLISLRLAAEKGHPDAQFGLALCYMVGLGVAKDVEQGATWLRAAAEQDHALAKTMLALCYLRGRGVPNDWEQAVKWLSSGTGDYPQGGLWRMAHEGVAFTLLRGLHVPKNRELAFSLLNQIGKRLDTRGAGLLGLCYLNGLGTHPDAEQALRWFLKAAINDHFEAQLMSAFLAEQVGEQINGDSEAWVIRLATNTNIDIHFSLIREFGSEMRQNVESLLTFLHNKVKNCEPAKVALARLIESRYFDVLVDSVTDLPTPKTLIEQAGKNNDPAALYYLVEKYYEAKDYERAEECINKLTHILTDPRSRSTPSKGHSVIEYPVDVTRRLLRSSHDKFATIHEIKKRRAIEDLMSMFSHQFRGALGTILFNTEHENDRAVYAHTARSMSGLVEISGVLSTSPESLQDGVAGDGAGQASPLTTLTSSLRDLIVDLTSKRNRARLSPYYRAYAQRHGWVSPNLKQTEWSQVLSCQQREQALQARWEEAAYALIHADIRALQQWMEQHWLPLSIKGFSEDTSNFSDYGPKASLLRVIFTEILRNAIKYSDPNTHQAIVLEWSRTEAGLNIRCANHSTPATRMREKSKGGGRGLKFLRMIASSLDGNFDADIYSNPSSVLMHLPNW